MNEKISADEFRAALDRHLSDLKADPRLAQRIIEHEEGEEPMMRKISASMVLAIVLICVLATGALAAALGGWEMIDFWDRHSGYIPENADEMISKEEIRGEAEHFVCTIQESYYDGCILRMTAKIEPKQPVMLLAEQDLPADPMEGNEEITIGEYAAQNYDGKMAELSFYLTTMEDEAGALALKRNEDGTASIYLEAYSPDESAEREIAAIVSYLPLGDVADKSIEELDSGEIEIYNFAAQERIEIPIHLQSVETRRYECHESMDFPSVGVQVTDIVMTATPLEIRYTLDYVITDLEKYNALEGGLWFEFIDPNSKETAYYAQRVSDGLTFTEGSGRLDGRFDEQDGIGTVIRQHGTIGLDALSEEYTIRAYSAWEKTRYETATFHVKESE